MDLLASHHYRKVPQFVVREPDTLMNATEALMALWAQFHFIYLFPSLKLLPRLLHRMEAEGIPVILVASDWPCDHLYGDMVQLVTNAPWLLPLREDLTSQSPVYHPALMSLVLMAWLLKSRF